MRECAEKQKKTGFAESASTGEADIYRYYRRALNEIGVRVQVDSGMTREWTSGIRTPVNEAKIVIVPSASTLCSSVNLIVSHLNTYFIVQHSNTGTFNMTAMRNCFKQPRNHHKSFDIGSEGRRCCGKT